MFVDKSHFCFFQGLFTECSQRALAIRILAVELICAVKYPGKFRAHICFIYSTGGMGMEPHSLKLSVIFLALHMNKISP